MLLVIDVGNSNIVFGVYEADELKSFFKMYSKTEKTSDEYGLSICELLKINGIDPKSIDGAVIASVVPNVMHALTNALGKYLGIKPLVVGPGVKTGISIVTPNPTEIGAGRIVDAVGAFYKYGGPVLVIDFSTATTYDIINAKGEFIAGITAPGIKISAEALWGYTAKLPEIEIKKPKSIMAQDTVSSMQAGLVYGQIGQTEYIIKKIKEESGLKDMKVVATGGFGRIISDETDSIDIFDRDVMLDGLKMIYERNKNRKSTTKK